MARSGFANFVAQSVTENHSRVGVPPAADKNGVLGAGAGEGRPSAFWWCLNLETQRCPWAAACLRVVTPFTAIPFRNLIFWHSPATLFDMRIGAHLGLMQPSLKTKKPAAGGGGLPFRKTSLRRRSGPSEFEALREELHCFDETQDTHSHRTFNRLLCSAAMRIMHALIHLRAISSTAPRCGQTQKRPRHQRA